MFWPVLLLMLPLPETKTIDTDLCELNHVWTHYDETWHCSSYFVWWDWDFHHEYGWNWFVREWRSCNDVPRPLGNVTEWQDKRSGKWMRVRHKVFKETNSLKDHEVENQKLLPAQYRRRFGE